MSLVAGGIDKKLPHNYLFGIPQNTEKPKKCPIKSSALFHKRQKYPREIKLFHIETISPQKNARLRVSVR
jgi:hypothetical protein